MGLNNEKNSGLVNLNIELLKTCYFPGELINGILILTPKPGISDAIFTDTKSHFIISERKFYKIRTNDHIQAYKYILEDNNILEKDLIFNNFLNENILLEIKIPFSIQLPINTYPSCYFSGDCAYVTHSLKVEFQNLKTFNTAIFIVKNPEYFNKENGLLKEPCEISKTVYKSKFLLSKGSFSAFIKLEKNYFFYDEPIIYEIILDCSELDLEINELIIKIIKSCQRNYKTNYNKAFIKSNEDVACQRITIDKNSKKFHFKDAIKIDKKHIPSLEYQKMDKDGPPQINENKELKDFFLTPCCYGGLLSVSFNLNIKLVFDSLLTFNEEFNIPLDFFERDNNTINLNNSIINISIFNMI